MTKPKDRRFNLALKFNTILFVCFLAALWVDSVSIKGMSDMETVLILILALPANLAFYSVQYFLCFVLYAWLLKVFLNSNKNLFKSISLLVTSIIYATIVLLYANNIFFFGNGFNNHLEIGFNAPTAFVKNDFKKLTGPTPQTYEKIKTLTVDPNVEATIDTNTVKVTPLVNRTWEEEIIFHHNRFSDLCVVYDRLGLQYELKLTHDNFITDVKLQNQAFIPLRIMWFKLRCLVRAKNNCLCQSLYLSTSHQSNTFREIDYYGTPIIYDLIPTESKLFYLNYFLILVLFLIALTILAKNLIKAIRSRFI